MKRTGPCACCGTFPAVAELPVPHGNPFGLIGLTAGNSNTIGVYTDIGVGAVKTAILGPYSGFGFNATLAAMLLVGACLAAWIGATRNRAGAMVADVPASGGRIDHDDRPGRDVAREDRFVRHGPGDRANVRELDTEYLLGHRLDPEFYFIHELETLIVPLLREPLRISCPKVAYEYLLR